MRRQRVVPVSGYGRQWVMRMASATTHRLLHHGRRSVAPAVVVMIRFARHVADRLAFLREERHGQCLYLSSPFNSGYRPRVLVVLFV